MQALVDDSLKENENTAHDNFICLEAIQLPLNNQ